MNRAGWSRAFWAPFDGGDHRLRAGAAAGV